MNILMLSERWFPSVGGGEYHIKNLTRELVKLGCEITLISRSLIGEKGTKGKPFESNYNGKFRVHRVPPTTPFKNIIGRATYPYFAVLKSIGMNNFDLVHAESFAANLPALMINKMFRIPVVTTVHGTYQGLWSNLVSSQIKQHLFENIERMILFRNYDRVITVDKYFISVARSRGFPLEKIVYIPNGVDYNRFDELRSIKKESGKPTFLYVGRLVKQKGLEYLIKGVGILRNKKNNFQVWIAGNGPLREKLNELSRSLNVTNYIRFLGNLSDNDITRLYCTADVFVLPSIWEGLPLALLEAWGAGLPVITTRVGGIPDVCVDRENALIVPAKDPTALAEAMLALIENETLSKKICSSGRKLVETQYNWQKIAERTLKVYEELI